MQALWSQPHVTFKGRYHTIEDAGINPRPASGRIPVWFGGHAEATLHRTAKFGALGRGEFGVSHFGLRSAK